MAEAKLADIDREESAAGALIKSMIENTAFSDTIALRTLELSLTPYFPTIAVISPTKPSVCCLCLTPATQRRSPLGLSALRDCVTNLPGR